MAVQWAVEEYTLSKIKKAIAYGWRMNNRQLYEYHRWLRKIQKRELPGELGVTFTAAVGQIADGQSGIGWPELMKDTEKIQRILQCSRQWDREEWLKRIPVLEARWGQYFCTGIGKVFLKILKEKIGMSVSGNKVGNGRSAIEVTYEMEQIADWLIKEDSQTQGVKYKEHSQAFAKLLDRAGIVVAACLSLCFLSIWLYGQAETWQSVYDIQKLKAAAITQQESVLENQNAAEASQQDGQGYGQANSDWNTEGDFAGQQTDEMRETEKPRRAKRPKILAQYREMAKEYPGLFGWLQIPDTQIDLPVMQPLKEKDFYLSHDFAGMESAEGALFADPQNKRWPQDGNTVIYGHNMKNGHMFGMLSQYKDKDYFYGHQKIHFDTIYETGIYEAVAVLKTRILNENEEGFRYYRFFQYDSKEEFQQCLDFIKENQLFDTGSVLQYKDRILMLSTCEYSQDNGRLVVVARKVGDAG